MSLKWRDDFAVGVKEIDDQHKELFNRINSLLEAMTQGKGQQVMDETFKFLQNYTRDHFRNEERLMTQYKYPEIDDHKSKHEAYTKQIKEMQSKVQAQQVSAAFTIEVQRFLTNWWTNHINNVDKKLGKFLQEQK